MNFMNSMAHLSFSIKRTVAVVVTPTIPTYTVSQPSFLQFNYRFNTGDIVGSTLANYASGTAVYDASVNAGASIISTAGNVAFGSGSMLFNGNALASIQLPSFTTDLNGFSVSCWFKSSSATLYRVCDFATDTTGGNNIVVAPTDGVQIYKGTASTTTPAVNLNNNAWQHLIFTSEKVFDANDTSGNFRLYINGVVNNTYSNSNFFYPPALTRTINYFGKSNNATSTNLTGYVDEFKLYKKALSATEAKNLYYFNNTTLSFNSLTFNGSNNATLSDPTYYGTTQLSSGGTMDFWVKIPSGTTLSGTNPTTLYAIIVKQQNYGVFLYNNKLYVNSWGDTPSSFTGGPSLNDGLWHHVALVFVSGTANGTLVYLDASNILTNTITYNTNDNPLTIASSNTTQYSVVGMSIAFLRIWNTLKTAAQISEIYNKYLDPALYSDMIGFYSFNEGSGRTVNNNSSNNRYAFDLSNSPVWSSVDIPTIKRNQGVLTSIPTGCRGLYACKWVNSNYTGPILKLRKSSQADNTNATNFYMDRTGTVVTTLPDASGTTFASWLGTDIAYVNVWYDQSLGGRDASQATTNRQPSYDSTNKRLNFTNNVKAYFNLTSGTLPYNNSSYTYIFKHGIVSSVAQGVLSGSDNLNFRFNSNGYREEHPLMSSYYSWANSNPGTISVATYKYDKTSTQLSCYVSGASLGNVQTVAISASASLSGNNYIGYNIGYGDNNALETELMHFSVYNTALSDNDRLLMENIDDIIINGNFVDSITGTSQLVYNETPVINWNLSAVDNSNVTFLIASILDTVYLEGTYTAPPYTALPSSITQMLVSKLASSGYSQSITQSISITSAGYYTFTFYHAGRTGTNLYASSHTLTVTLGTTTVVANLATSTLGWQQYTGYIEFSTLDIGTKNLTFTFSSSSALNSSYYITGVALKYTSPMALYSSVPVGSVGLYACRWVNNNYTGPILRIRKSTDTTTGTISSATFQDFYMDKTGTVITTGANGTGQKLTDWLGGATPYVVIWYDQTLGGNHGIQPTAGYQPTLVLFNGLYTVYFYTSGLTPDNPTYLGLTKPAFNTGNNSFTIISKLADTTSIPTSGYKMFFSTGSNANYQIQQAFNNRIIQHTWYGGNGATYTPTWSNNLLISCDYNSASTYSKRIYLNGATTPVATLASGTALSLLYSTSTPDIYGCIGAYGGQYLTSTTTIDKQYCLPGSFSHLSLYNNMLNDTNRQTMENIDAFMLTTSPFIVNGNFIDYITGTSQTVLNSTPVINWTLSTVDSSNVKFLIAKTTDTTYARGATATAPLVALPATITQFMVSQIVTAGYSQTISQLVKVASAGTYTLTFYYAGRSTASKYTVNHTLTVSLGSTTLVTNLSASTSGWQLYTGTVTMATADIGIKNLKFTFYNGETFDSSYYITGVNVVYSSNLNTINTNTINNLIPGVTPWGIYDASLWNSTTKILPEARGITARDASGSGAGTFTYSSGISGNGAVASVPQLSGGTTSIMSWPAGSWPTNFTICAIGRFTALNNSRLFTTINIAGGSNNFLGFGTNAFGYVYLDGTRSSTVASNTNWSVICAKNTPNTSAGTALNTVLLNGTAIGTATGGAVIAGSQITLNGYTGNESNWALTYLVIYDSVLTDAQVATVSTKLQNYLATGSMVDSYTTNISRAIYPSVPTGSVGLYACKWVNNLYKGPILKLRRNNDANTGTTNPSFQDFYMDKTGTVITTLPDGSGNTFATWLSTNSATSAYVVIWYDQSVTGSGGGNNATTDIASNALQPLYDSTTNSVYFNGNLLNIPSTILPTGNNRFSYTFKLNNIQTTASNYAFAIGDLATNTCLYLSISNNGFTNTIAGLGTSPAYSRVPTIRDVITCDYDLSKLNIYNKGFSTSVATANYTTFNLAQTLKNTNVIGGAYNSSAAAYASGQNIANIKYSYFSIFNTTLTTTNRQIMENIDDTIINRNFGQTITGTSQLVSNDTPVFGWTLSAIDNTNSAFLIATTSDTTTYTRGVSVAYPYVTLPATITQFLVSQIVNAGYSHTVTQSVKITTAGIYAISFYHAGRSGTTPYTSNHKLTVSLGSTNIVTDLSSSATGWQLYTGYMNADIGTKDLKFTFTNSQTYNSSFYVSGIDFNYIGGTGLLTTIPTGSLCLFACKWVNNNYMGPIFKLRRSTDSVLQDFYMDSTGYNIGTLPNGTGYNIGTLPNGTGQSLSTWLSSATAYVQTWYDQSLSGKHAVQLTTANQPTYDLTSNVINFGTTGYFILPDSSFPTNNNAFSIVYNYSGKGIYTGTLFQSGSYNNSVAIRTSPLMALLMNGSTNYQLTNDKYTTQGSDTEAFVYSPVSGTAGSCVFHQIGNTSSTLSTINYTGTGETKCYLGFGTSTGFNIYFGATLSNFSIFNTALTGTLDNKTSDLGIMGNISTLIVTNGSFDQYYSGTNVQFTLTTFAKNWTTSDTNFYLVSTTDTTYIDGTSTTSPYVALPTLTASTRVWQFLMSKLTTVNIAVSHNIKQSVNIPVAGLYTLTFYHAGRIGTNTYSTNHTLQVDIDTQNIVTGLQTTTATEANVATVGWNLYTGSVAITSSGTKELKFTFTNSNTTATESSYYITGIDLKYLSINTGTLLAGANTNTYVVTGQSNSLLNGTYTMSASSAYSSFPVYNGFTEPGTSIWHALFNGAGYTRDPYIINTLNPSIYNYQGGQLPAYVYSTTASGRIYQGEWLQIQFPIPFILTNYTLTLYSTFPNWNGRGPAEWYVVGSTDGITWNLVHYNSYDTPPDNGISSIAFPCRENTAFYSYYRIIFNKVFNSSVIHIGAWILRNK